MDDWFDGGSSNAPVDVLALLDSGASDLLNAVVSLGALLSLGLTSDGGALAVTITVDGRWRREYFRDTEAMFAWLEEAMPHIKDACTSRSASSAPRKRQRGTRER